MAFPQRERHFCMPGRSVLFRQGGEVIGLIRVCDCADHAAGIPGGDHAGRNAFGHHAARTDDGVVTDGHPGEDFDVPAQPHAFADVNRCAGAPAFDPLLCVDRVIERIDADIRTEQRVVADRNPGAVQPKLM